MPKGLFKSQSHENLILGVLLIGMMLIQAGRLRAKPEGFYMLNSLAHQCFLNYKAIEPCQRALEITELLQRSARANKNYPCQTSALGLGADLLISQIGQSRGLLAFKALERVKKFCDFN